MEKNYIIVNMIAGEPKLQIFNQITQSFDDILYNYNLINNLPLKDNIEFDGYTLCVLNGEE